MPPKQRITKDMIMNTVLSITRESGFDHVNARSIADSLNCSTRPVFTCYENMEKLKRDFLDFAYDFYIHYTENYIKSSNIDERLFFPITYIEFAKEEPELFKLLFIYDMELNMHKATDFYNEADNIRNAERFAHTIGAEVNTAKKVFLDLFLYSHGIAVLTATKKYTPDIEGISDMLMNILDLLLRQIETKEIEL